MILTEGKKTNKELAEWFGITAGTFANTKKQRLEELKDFAEFHMEGIKVVIDKVIISEYTNQAKQNYLKVKNKVNPNWNKNGLDSCTRVAKIIYEQLIKEDESFKLQNNTVYQYTRRSRNELYGKPFSSGGEIGKCEYIWCKKINNNYEFLTEEEKNIRDKLIKKYFGDATQKQLLVKQMVQEGELKTEEAFEYLNQITGMTDDKFLFFLKELEITLGCQIVKGTYVEWSAFETETTD